MMQRQNSGSSWSSSLRQPFGATKLWLEMVAIFRKGVPLGKHRMYFKLYEDCFVAQDAISWFHRQLQENIDSGIARKQALQLLQKFYRSGIFVPVSNRASLAEESFPVIKETDFKDNGSLYRLSGYTSDNNDTLRNARSKKSPGSRTLLSQASRSRIPSASQIKYDVIINPLTPEQIGIIWRDVFIHRFVQIVGCEAFQAFNNVEIRGNYIRHNLTQIDNFGFVLVASTEDVPPWLDRAMETVATWPRSRNSADQPLCHVNYPGFENDVFKLILDYFKSYKGSPLLTFELYDAFITTFIRAELFDFNARLYSAKTTSASRSRLCHQLNLPFVPPGGGRTPQSISQIREEQYPFNASESVENLIMDILTPASQRENNSARRGRGVTSRIQPKRLIPAPLNSQPSVSENVSMNPMMEDSVLRSVPEPMSAKSYTAERYKNPYFFETAFTSSSSPITRVVSETELKSTFCTLPRKAPTVPVGPMSTPPYYAYENPNLELSASDMINHPKYSRIVRSSNIASWSQMPNYSSLCNTSLRQDSIETYRQSPYRILPNRSHSSVNLSDAVRDRSPYVPGAGQFVGRNPQGIAAEYAKSPSKSARRTLDYYYGADACVPGLMTTEGKQMAISAFRLLTLLLPTAQRKHLHLLLNFMSKSAVNDKLMLDVAVTTRRLTINTFYRFILNSFDPREFDELLALRIVTFMVDNAADIFAVAEEEELKHQVDEILSEEQVTKIPIKEPTPPLAPSSSQNTERKEAVTSTNSLPLKMKKSKSKLKRFSSENKENENVRLQYCSKISIDEYENQRLLGSGGTSQSLRNLLDSIATDPKMDEEFRRKKLVQFRSEYPHIFAEKYTEEQYEYLNRSMKEEKKKERNPFSTLLKPFRRN